MKKLGIYIHIPFCVRKCLYCDFLSFEGMKEETQRSYAEAVQSELSYYGKCYGRNFIVDSVFFGGGTPSLLDGSLIQAIMRTLKEHFFLEREAEITIESNPKTLDEHKLKGYRQAGINRISIGVQTLDDKTLKVLGRAHEAEDAVAAVRLAREAGFNNINLDLMFAVPGHTLEVWQKTLNQALDLKPEHLSFYSLQLEEGTPYFRLFEKGQLDLVSDEKDRQMYHLAINQLEEAGYRHYEISNASRPGFECRHNLKYWSMEDYLGIGLGAHSYIQGERFSNVTNMEIYLDALNSEKSFIGKQTEKRQKEPGAPEPPAEDLPWVEWRHENSQRDEMVDYMITGLRRREGISLADFRNRFGKTLFQAYPKQEAYIREQIKAGMLLLEDGWLRFTLTGIDLSNQILAEFV